MRNKVLSILLLAMLLFTAACTAQATPTAEPATEAPATEAPTAEPVTLTVMAAASLTEPFQKIGAAFEAAHPNVTVEFNFAGSQTLADQLDQGAPADVFASASTKYMDSAISDGRVDKDASKAFAMNKLIVIYPKDNPAQIATLADLVKPGIKIDLASEDVPVGKYSITFLENASKDATLGETYKEDFLKNVVSYEDNVKAVLTKVSLGEADAGIVYVSDISGDFADKVGKLTIPDTLNSIATYPIAPVANSANLDIANAFVEMVMSEDGQAILNKYNFFPAANSFTVTDALGRTVLFSKSPDHVVVVGKALFMIADAIYMFPEAGQKIVAMGSPVQGSGNFVSMIDPNAAAKITLTGDTVGAEQIAAAGPDLVIMKSSNQQTLGGPLEALGIPVVYLDFETPEQYTRDLATLGQIFGNPDRAAELSKYFSGKTEAITKETATLSDDQKPSVLVVYYNNKGDAVSFNVPPLSWIQTTQVIDAGGDPVWKDSELGKSWTTVTVEQIASWNPDVIFLVSYFSPVNDVVASLKADPQWSELKAVKDGKLYGFASDVYSWDQSDTRWILGLTWMAGKLHPDLFPTLDIKSEAQTFYQTLYNMDSATFESTIVPLFSGDIN